MCLSGSIASIAADSSAAPPPPRGPFDTRPIVAILGLYRGGTSAVAGILQQLGLEMGRLLPASKDNPSGFYEDIFLRGRLRQMWDEPTFARWPGSAQRVAALREWRRSLVVEQPTMPSAPSAPMVAVKHPLLCLMGSQMIRSWGPATRFISILRPMDDCLASLERVGWWPPGVSQMIQQRLWAARENLLATRPHLSLEYNDLLIDPQTQIARIVQYLSLNVPAPASAAARDFIRKAPRVP
jgi:hypothetical protein